MENFWGKIGGCVAETVPPDIRGGLPRGLCALVLTCPRSCLSHRSSAYIVVHSLYNFYVIKNLLLLAAEKNSRDFFGQPDSGFIPCAECAPVQYLEHMPQHDLERMLQRIISIAPHLTPSA